MLPNGANFSVAVVGGSSLAHREKPEPAAILLGERQLAY